MSRSFPTSPLLLLCLILALPLLGACAKSAPTNFYSLTTEKSEPEQTAGRCYSLGVGPIDLPAYLDRTQIVSRGEGNRMILAEFDQWIEPAQANFTHALTDALSRLVCAKPLVTLPWPVGMRPDYQVSAQIKEFDGALGKEAVLRADWSVLNADGRVLVWKSTNVREKCAGPDYAALVAAQSRLVDKLAAEMVAALAALPTK